MQNIQGMEESWRHEQGQRKRALDKHQHVAPVLPEKARAMAPVVIDAKLP